MKLHHQAGLGIHQTIMNALACEVQTILNIDNIYPTSRMEGLDFILMYFVVLYQSDEYTVILNDTILELKQRAPGTFRGFKSTTFTTLYRGVISDPDSITELLNFFRGLNANIA